MARCLSECLLIEVKLYLILFIVLMLMYAKWSSFYVTLQIFQEPQGRIT